MRKTLQIRKGVSMFSKRVGIDLGIPYNAYLLPRFTSLRRKSAYTGQAANKERSFNVL